MVRVVIPGTFPGLNQYIDANRISRGKWNKGNSMKQRDMRRICSYLPKIHLRGPLYIRYVYYCKDRRRDLDNISGYFHKVFQDALVMGQLIPNDNWRYIKGFSDEFRFDRQDPRIEIIIYEDTE